MRNKRFGMAIAALFVAIFFLGDRQLLMAAEGTVRIESLKIGGKTIGDGVKKTLFYMQLLPGGKIYVNGKAISKGDELVSVEVTQDGKKTWRKASLAPDGFFEYSFRPKADDSYGVCIKATTAKGMATLMLPAQK
jgi:hypothetical protein